MKLSVRRLCFGALCTALTVVLLYFGGLFPTGVLAFSAAAALFTAGCRITSGTETALLSFGASLLLGLLLMPDKAPVLYYIFFFGWYPFIKCYADEKLKPPFGRLVKQVSCNIALLLLALFFRSLLNFPFLLGFNGIVFWLLLFAGTNAVFYVYDIGLSKFFRYYRKHISPRFKC